jgi:hypothetical protein
VTAGGLCFSATFFTPHAARVFATRVAPMAPDDERAATFIRRRVRPGEMVYRRSGSASGYAAWAGLPIPFIDWGTGTFGFPEHRLRSRQRLLVEMPREPERWLAEGVAWFVLDDADVVLSEAARDWVGSGRASVLAEFGPLRVLKLRP